MKPFTLPKSDFNDYQQIPHYVYDMSLPLSGRPLKKKRFESGVAAANWLGIPSKELFKARGTKRAIESPIYHKKFFITVAPKIAAEN